MTRYTPQKIEDIGLQAHLESTKVMHKNQGYENFKFYMEHETAHATIARYFGVDRKTVSKWVIIYKKEQENVIN